MNIKKYRLLRNIFIISGIVIALIIWFFMPSTFKNSPLFHVGNGEYGTKWGALLLLPLPLFSLLFRQKKLEFYGDDEEYNKSEQEKADKKSMQLGMVTALGLSILIIALMTAGFFLAKSVKKSVTVEKVTSEAEKDPADPVTEDVADEDHGIDDEGIREDAGTPIKILKYEYTDERGFNDAVEIKLFSDGTFELSESYLSSRIITGYWDIYGGVLCLENNAFDSTDDINDFEENCFRIVGDAAVYLKGYSNGFSEQDIEEGETFADTDAETGSLLEVLVNAGNDLGGAPHVNRNPYVYREADELFLGEWKSSDGESDEYMIISMADPQVGGYHFEITRGDSVIAYGDAYSSEGRLTLTQAIFNNDSMDGSMMIYESSLSFKFGFHGKDNNGEYVGDGIMEFVRAD